MLEIDLELGAVGRGDAAVAEVQVEDAATDLEIGARAQRIDLDALAFQEHAAGAAVLGKARAGRPWPSAASAELISTYSPTTIPHRRRGVGAEGALSSRAWAGSALFLKPFSPVASARPSRKTMSNSGLTACKNQAFGVLRHQAHARGSGCRARRLGVVLKFLASGASSACRYSPKSRMRQLLAIAELRHLPTSADVLRGMRRRVVVGDRPSCARDLDQPDLRRGQHRGVADLERGSSATTTRRPRDRRRSMLAGAGLDGTV